MGLVTSKRSDQQCWGNKLNDARFFSSVTVTVLTTIFSNEHQNFTPLYLLITFYCAKSFTGEQTEINHALRNSETSSLTFVLCTVMVLFVSQFVHTFQVINRFIDWIQLTD